MQHFEQLPSIIPAIWRALFLPRRGLRSGETLPRLAASINHLAIDQQQLANYRAVCQLKAGSNLPLCYPHVLAAPLHMWLITHPQFPLRLLGAVHLRNHIIQQQPLAADGVFDLHCAITAERRTDKGLEFDFITTVQCDTQILWEGLTTYFVRGKFGNAETPSALSELEKLIDGETVAEWPVPDNLGKRYAFICRDFNPIHISRLLAKLFGFQRDLAHGFCVLATSLEKAGLNANAGQHAAQRLDVLFKGPMYLGHHARLMRHNNRLDLFCDGNDRPSLCINFSTTARGSHLPGVIGN